jgi:hypothetical protein
MAQKNISKENKFIPKKKVVKKSVTKEDDPDEVQNLMELIDIKKIVQDLVHKELQRLGIINLSVQKKDDDEYIDDPMDVDLTWIKNAKDLATVEGKIGNLLLSVVVDSASNKDIMPKFIADELGLKIDTSVTHNICGIPGENKSVGIASASIVLAPECIIKTNFTIMDNYPIREVILSRTTLKNRYNYDLHESRDHMAITCNEKNFFIPIVPDRNRQKKKISDNIVEEVLA